MKDGLYIGSCFEKDTRDMVEKLVKMECTDMLYYIERVGDCSFRYKYGMYPMLGIVRSPAGKRLYCIKYGEGFDSDMDNLMKECISKYKYKSLIRKILAVFYLFNIDDIVKIISTFIDDYVKTADVVAMSYDNDRLDMMLGELENIECSERMKNSWNRRNVVKRQSAQSQLFRSKKKANERKDI